MTNRYKHISKKALGKVLALAVFASLVSSANVFAAPNDHMPQRIEQGNGPINQGVYNGYKGYRHHRPGYQRHSDGWWYPDAAFRQVRPAPPAYGGPHNADRGPLPPLANHLDQSPPNRPGMNRPVPPSANLSQRHIKWCAQQYRTYRPSDNSFAIKKGERRICISPFSR
ncbi:BA14K family protein [Bartonella sp. HY329]|uniref:BA14K family protein n=1 Tax=unclassified Bartonella TaxID=2645622 RepID=UPI0021C98BD7|nr:MULTISPECIES: BA14K family protein [unclassified Bartonella]UXM95195.1 BA14K family protein [Bartonella sp. HY329]UXN09518.1 BA14K family protein [Bartonella sp. HY328]